MPYQFELSGSEATITKLADNARSHHNLEEQGIKNHYS